MIKLYSKINCGLAPHMVKILDPLYGKTLSKSTAYGRVELPNRSRKFGNFCEDFIFVIIKPFAK